MEWIITLLFLKKYIFIENLGHGRIQEKFIFKQSTAMVNI